MCKNLNILKEHLEEYWDLTSGIYISQIVTELLYEPIKT